MEFKKYQHIERLGTDETEGIEIGHCYIFPKIDGTNGSVWIDGDKICAGSRNRELTLDNDNQGFFSKIINDENIIQFFNNNKNLRLYGEFLIPHSLRTYRDEAWGKFYVFDVMDGERYLRYDEYKQLLDEYNINYIPCMAILKNPSIDDFILWMNRNNYLIKDGLGIGEGIIIKNYEYMNKYGRQTWAKIVTSEFKEKHNKIMGAPIVNCTKMIEEEIANKYCTEAIVEKTFQKIKNDSGWNSKKIPELLSRVYHDIITEECWNFVKEYKNPKIDFRVLHNFIISKIKSFKSELF